MFLSSKAPVSFTFALLMNQDKSFIKSKHFISVKLLYILAEKLNYNPKCLMQITKENTIFAQLGEASFKVVDHTLYKRKPGCSQSGPTVNTKSLIVFTLFQFTIKIANYA